MISTYLKPTTDLLLAPNEIHIWYADLDQQEHRFHSFIQTLSTDEVARAERFHFEQDRKRFIVRRGILRTILGRYLSVEPNRLRFSYGKSGKPALADTSGNGTIHFNMSDSHGLALFAFTRNRQIGVDIEHIREISEMDQIVERAFSIREYLVFRALPEGKKTEAFFNCWTRKEAFVKAKGEGLRLSLNQFEVSLAPGEQAALVNTKKDPEEASCWELRDLDIGPGFVAALAVHGHSWQLKYWQWGE